MMSRTALTQLSDGTVLETLEAGEKTPLCQMVCEAVIPYRVILLNITEAIAFWSS